MEEFAGILLLLVASTTVHATEAVYRQSLYEGVKLGRNITGKIGAEFRSRFNLECSSRCSLDVACVAYKYEKSSPNICHLVVNTAADDIQTFVSDDSSLIYKATIGPQAVIYRSFDTLDNLTLMEGNAEGNFSALVPGKLNMAVETNLTQQWWVNLGNLSAACITIPDTCGPEGAAVAFWVKLIDTPYSGGGEFITSRQDFTSTGFYFRADDYFYMLAVLKLSDGSSFGTSFRAVGGTWIHMILNYIRSEHGQGIRIHYNGAKLDGGDNKHTGGKLASPSDGTVVVGKFESDYSSVAIDELWFFNVKLTSDQIRELYNQSFP